MSYSNEAKYIEQRFATNWGSTTAIKYANVDFDPPAASAWVDLQVVSGPSRKISLGGSTNLRRYTGIVSINIYVPTNTGTRTARGYVDTASAIFRDASFNGIICRDPSVTDLGERNGWRVHNVSVEFQRDEIE